MTKPGMLLRDDLDTLRNNAAYMRVLNVLVVNSQAADHDAIAHVGPHGDVLRGRARGLREALEILTPSSITIPTNRS